MKKVGSEEFGFMYEGLYSWETAQEYRNNALTLNHPMTTWNENKGYKDRIICYTSACLACGAIIYLFETDYVSKAEEEGWSIFHKSKDEALSVYEELLNSCQSTYIGEDKVMAHIGAGNES